MADEENDNNDPPKVLEPKPPTTIPEPTHLDEGGGGTGGGDSGVGAGSVDVATPDSSESHFAACQGRHPFLIFFSRDWIGPTRSGPDAVQQAQADAEAHNRDFPGHEAGVI